MPERVTDAEVAEIVDVDSGTDFAPFILTATLLTDDVAENDTGGKLDAARLKEIERYLAAHFYSMFEQQPASEHAKTVSQSFQHRVDIGLDFTRYGQQAKLLDSTGYLARLNAIAKGTGTRRARLNSHGDYDENRT